MTVGVADHILASSVLQYRHFRVPAFDRRRTFVELGVSGGDWPPLRGRDGHLSPAWYAVEQMLPLKISAALLQQRQICIVSARAAREGPNTQDQDERLMAETGHHLDVTRLPFVTFEFHRLTVDTRCNG